jgi:hypothetical protein
MATQASIQIDNPQFVKKIPSRYDCFILLGKNYLNYALLDEEHAIVYTIRHFDFKNQTIGKSDFDEILSDRTLQKSTRFFMAVDTLKTTLIPNEFYTSTSKLDYIKHLFDLTNEEELHEMKLNNDMTDLFVLKKDSIQYLKNRLRNVLFFDANASVLNTYPTHIHTEDESSIFVALKHSSVTLTTYKSKQLIHHQVYSFSDLDDILFYIANIIKHQNLNAKTIGIHVQGESSNIQQAHDLLSNHFNHVRFCSRLHELSYPEELFSQPSHYFFNLFSLVLCVS